MEQWKPIKDYEGIYEVSSWGRVRSLDRLVTKTEKGTAYTIMQKGRMLMLGKNNNGYLCSHLYKDGKRHAVEVHRLVASAFIPNPLNLEQVNHKDLDKTNNHVENLEWLSRADNNRHAVRNGAGGGAKLKREVTILRNGKEIGTFPSYSSAAMFLRCKPQDIMNVVGGRQKSARGCTFRVK